MVNECENGSHDCDPNAKCVDTFDGYTCACQSGYFDQSEVDKPGRICVLPLDNCASGRSGCDPNAVCTDTYNGVSCRCKNGRRPSIFSKQSKDCRIRGLERRPQPSGPQVPKAAERVREPDAQHLLQVRTCFHSLLTIKNSDLPSASTSWSATVASANKATKT